MDISDFDGYGRDNYCCISLQNNSHHNTNYRYLRGHQASATKIAVS